VTHRQKIAGAIALGVVAGIAVVLLVHAYRRAPVEPPPVRLVNTIVGAVMEQAADPRGQAPIADVEVSVGDNVAAGIARTNFSGFFSLEVSPGIEEGRTFMLQFSHAGYQPLAIPAVAGEQLYVARMIPLHPQEEKQVVVTPTVEVSGVVVRYSVRSTTTATVGTAAKTFQVANTANVPCDDHAHSPCSPDGKWKAAAATVSLDAGPGNVLADPRVSCIAGPCPFTKTEIEDHAKAGRVVTVKALSWSDTTTFLLQGEVIQAQVSDMVQRSYPVIYDRELNFSLPPTARGPSLEATLNGVPIVFPLPPNPDLVWAACKVRQESDGTKQYRCELKPGYQFRHESGTAMTPTAAGQ
jgi:hypothetical protein